MRTLALTVILLMAPTVVGLNASAAAGARAGEVATSSSFGVTDSGGEAALGTITSSKPDCVSKRKVVLYQVRPGADRSVGTDRRSGSPVGNGDGYWMIETNLRDGKRYYAVVLRKVVGPHVCRAYRSSAVRFRAS